MISGKTKWHSLPWILVIGGGILSPIFTDLYNRVPIYTSFVWIWDMLLTLLNWELKFWWVLILVGILSLIIFFSNKPKLNDEYRNITDLAFEGVDSWKKEENKEAKEARMLDYTADKFNGIIWIWDWIYNDLISQYEVKNIIPLCPHSTCKNVAMSFGSSGNYSKYYLCPNCNSSTSINYTSIVNENTVFKQVNNY